MLRSKLLWFVLFGFVLFGGGAAVYTMTRGLRNNNPGNIRRVPGVTWQGQSDAQTDAAFVQFVNPTYGIRALARTLNTYIHKHGLRTIRAIISRWSPHEENDTDAYVDSVAESVGVGADMALPDNAFQALVSAIIEHENGINPYTDEEIAGGIALA
jgi:hypothetical protein